MKLLFCNDVIFLPMKVVFQTKEFSLKKMFTNHIFI